MFCSAPKMPNLNDVLERLHEAAFERLNNLLTHGDVRVLQAVSRAAHYLIGTKYAKSRPILGKNE